MVRTFRLWAGAGVLLIVGTLLAQDPKEKTQPPAAQPPAAQPPATAQPSGDAEGYFPLTPKSKWVYKVQDQTVEVVVDRNEKIKNETCTKVDTLVSGKVVASEIYCVRTDGLYRVKVKDDEITPPVKVLALPVKKGEGWTIDSKVGAQGGQTVKGAFKIANDKEKVKVPAGEFDAVLVEGVDLDVAGTKTTVRMWFVKGVGLVKLAYKIADAESTLELEKYDIPVSKG